jgi:hypothetical protein
LLLDPSDGAGLSWLYRHSEVLSRQCEMTGVWSSACVLMQRRQKW